jgi:hypothetical protein
MHSKILKVEDFCMLIIIKQFDMHGVFGSMYIKFKMNML